jgi:Tfp pilus assembly protein PilX
MTNKMANKAAHKANKGVALVLTLLILSLFTIMTLSMVIATTSDTMINGYYKSARGSFYAADSGANILRQYMINQLQADFSSTYNVWTNPVTSGQISTTLSNLSNTSTGFGAYQSIIGSQSSWKGKFKVVYDSTCATTGGAGCPTFIQYPPTCSVGTFAQCTNGTGISGMNSYTLFYPYKITVTGQSSGAETNTIEEQGSLTVGVTVRTTQTASFADYGLFVDQSPICNGSYLVPGTISGPVFTNGSWNFGTSGSYIFTDSVGQHGSQFGYQFSSCVQSAAGSATSGAQTIHPTFQAGFSVGQTAENIPANSYSQKGAVIDGIGATSPSNATLASDLRNPTSGAWSTSATSGVYLPYISSGTSALTGQPCPCMNNTVTTSIGVEAAGGIYVQGNATVTVTASGSSSQVYTIVQGANTTVVTITPDSAYPNTGKGTTTVQINGGTTTTVQGVPVQLDSTGSTVSRDATMLYVAGSITALKGGGQGVGTIQDSTALSIVADGDVTITGDLLYKTEPVTFAQSGSTPADSLISGSDHGQTLGIYTASGNINLANAQSSGNLEIDASIAALGASGSSNTLQNTGSAINTLTIVGGRIQSALGNINTTTRNVWFDRRYGTNGFAPPWFPSTTSTTTYVTPVPTSGVKRVSWVNTTAQ